MIWAGFIYDVTSSFDSRPTKEKSVEGGQVHTLRLWSSGQKSSNRRPLFMNCAACCMRPKVLWWHPRFQHVDTSHCTSLLQPCTHYVHPSSFRTHVQRQILHKVYDACHCTSQGNFLMFAACAASCKVSTYYGSVDETRHLSNKETNSTASKSVRVQ